MSREAISLSQPQPSILSAGLALFSMFFGAGNIIFPLIVGRLSGTETPYAIIGLGFSAVAFPFLGLMAMMFYSGNIHSFLARLGKGPAFALLFALQMSQGPIGAMPRLLTLMHASIKSYFPNLSLLIFSFIVCGIVFILTVRPQRIIHFLGAILTPLLLLTLGLIILIGSVWAPAAQPVDQGSIYHFGQGLKLGYQTMDLTAALLFATVVLPHLSQGIQDQRLIRRRMTQASLIASGLLMATYIGLCWISAHHSWTFGDVPPECLLHRIALQTLGPVGGIISAAAVFLACFTTAISLASVFSSYLRQNIFKDRINNPTALSITLAVTAIFACLGFSGIVKLWGPLLEILYPALIVICVLNIAHALYRVKPIQVPVFLTLGVAAGGYYFF
jgi:LIVCS family branched-chain amino acid:cation transporter